MPGAEDRMDAHSWSRVRELFAAAVLLDPEDRSAFLNDNCGDGAELRREVESLLEHDLEAGERGDAIGDVVRAEARGIVGDGDLPSAEAAPAPDPLVGQRVGQIRVLQLLGSGGMGKVYVGFDETLQRRVALKSIRARHRLAADSRARFLREARMLSQLEHPNICRIHNYIEGDDSDFLVLELIEGGDLAAAIANGLEPAQKLKVAIQIAAVLEAAHGQGIVHRDLKPQNVMLTPEGEAKVLDFGLARSEELVARESTGFGPARTEPTEPDAPEPDAPPEDRTLAFPDESSADTALMTSDHGSSTNRDATVQTRLGQLVGTPVFMSPEQASGETVSTASDMYSFGLLLQALFTGTSPYPDGLDSVEILSRARRAETLPVAGIDKDLTALVERLKSAAPAARPTAVTTLERLRWIRDKPKRRLRRLIAAGVLALIALAGAKYTFDLKVARDEADRRRGQAEDLIGFMIGDLRSKLAPVNRLEVLDNIGDKALEYFAAVPAEDLSAKELLFRSETLSQIGQVRMDQGDLAEALEAFEQSLALTRRLIRRDPANNEWLAGLGAAHFWVGYVDWQRGNLEGALASYGDYLYVSRKLVERDPENLDWQLELSYAHNNIGSVLAAQGQAQEAVEAFRASLEIKKRLVAEQSENKSWQRDLAGTHSWMGEALLASADLEGALENYEANRAILERLSEKDTANLRLRYLLGIAHEKVAHVLDAAGRPGEARAHFETYLAINLELAQNDPDNSNWREELAVSHWRLGELSLQFGDKELARDHLRNARTILSDLVLSDPTNADWRLELAQCELARARLLTADGALREAEAVVFEVAELLEPMIQQEATDPKVRFLMSSADLALGAIYLETGLADQAGPFLGRALEMIEPLAKTSRYPFYRELQVKVLLRLDRLEDARAIAAQLDRDGFRKADFVRLCRERGVWS